MASLGLSFVLLQEVVVYHYDDIVFKMCIGTLSCGNYGS